MAKVQEKVDSPIDVANAKSLEEFVRDYLPYG